MDSKWGARLGVFEIRYKLRNSVEGQVLVDFVAKFIAPLLGAVGVCQTQRGQWKVFVDGASNARGQGSGLC